jgi:hypothetical protein
MFRKKTSQRVNTKINNIDAKETVSQVGEIYANLNEQGQFIKQRSLLPYPWFVVRECFTTAFETEYPELSEDIRNSYHFVYSELAFFIEDDLYNDFNVALDIAAKCKIEKVQKLHVSTRDETYWKNWIASDTVKVQNREEIWASLADMDTCPRKHLLLLAETLTYCGELHRAMWDEWTTFANLIAYRNDMMI